MQEIANYMQHGIRVTLDNGGTLPKTVLVLPATYASSLPPIGDDVDIWEAKGNTDKNHFIRMNTIVIQDRSCGKDYWEHCLSAGGNLSTVVLDKRVASDAAYTLALSVVAH